MQDFLIADNVSGWDIISCLEICLYHFFMQKYYEKNPPSLVLNKSKMMCILFLLLCGLFVLFIVTSHPSFFNQIGTRPENTSNTPHTSRISKSTSKFQTSCLSDLHTYFHLFDSFKVPTGMLLHFWFKIPYTIPRGNWKAH